MRKEKKDRILEISSKSEVVTGRELSAFNLKIEAKDKRVFTVECAFQSSKVFEKGGPYLDILNKTSKEAKRDERLKSSGKLKAFQFYDTLWELEPKTLFYDWLYIRAVFKNEELRKEIIKYDAFTDIEFNPLKAINCQAKAAALYVSLYRQGLLNRAMRSIEDYKKVILENNITQIELNIDI